ncbi:MAG: protein translocase subunit SecD, partial [Actinomycetaceae bacterium]|nr:protein translocase subunit SecD [Actinomycetaceae bacterium]
MAQRNTLHKAEPKAGKRLIVLAILIVILLVSLGTASFTSGKSRWTPDFALDLEGGTQIILKPVTTDGSKVSDSDIEQAIEIIRQRVDASGVSEAEISAQGANNILVSLPG